MQGHVRQRKNRDGSPGGWQVIVSLGRDPITGKRRQVSATAPTKRAAMVLRNRMLVTAGINTATGTEATVKQMWDHFVVIAAPQWPVTQVTYDSVWRSHIEPAIGTMAAKDLRGRHLNDIYITMLKAGMAPATVRKCHTVLSSLCTYGVKNEWMVANPARNASPPKVERTKVRATPEVDIATLLGALEGHEFGLFVLVSAALGTRRGETLGLRWGDIDFVADTVTISRRVTPEPGGAVVREFTKGGGSRTICVDPHTIERLRDRLMQAQAEAALCEGELADGAFVFCDPVTGKPRHPSTVTHKMAAMRKELGLTDAHLHGLRHHVATSLLAAGVDVRTVAERLGNGANVVLSTYAHYVPAADRAAAGILGGILNRGADASPVES